MKILTSTFQRDARVREMLRAVKRWTDAMSGRVTRAAAVLALCGGHARIGCAQVAPARGGALTLDDAIAAAMATNPDVRIARAGLDSARAETRIARAFPNPTLAGNPNTPYQYNVTIPVDIGPQRTYRVRASELGLTASSADAADVTRQITAAVARAFYDVLLADARLVVVKRRRDNVFVLLQADSARARAGDIPERAITRSEVELARADADVTRASIDQQTSRLALQTLMGVITPDTALVMAGSLAYRPVTLQTDSLVATALRVRPDIAAIRTRELQSRALIGAARAQLVPIPQLTMSRQITAPFDGGSYYSFGVSFDVPLFNQYGGQRDRATAGLEAASFTRLRLEAQVRRDVLQAVGELRAQRSLVERYEGGLLQKVSANVSATRYAYERGATSLLEVLDAVKDQQEITLDYQAALHDYAISVRLLEAAVGSRLAGT